MKTLMIIISLLFVVAGCGNAKEVVQRDSRQAAEPFDALSSPVVPVLPDDRPSAKKVRWVYMSYPIPMGNVNNTMYADQNPEKVRQLLQWIDQAKHINGSGIQSPLHGRSMAIEIVYADGKTQEIRPAWKCNSFKNAQGNTETDCKPVMNKVVIFGTDQHEQFAISEPLYTLVSATYKKWMPETRSYELPDSITIGEPFRIAGHGWLAEKAVVELSKDKQIVWSSGEVLIDHGEFQVTGVLDNGINAADDYNLDIKGIPYRNFPYLGNNYGAFIKVVQDKH
jgi:hypothetical protein